MGWREKAKPVNGLLGVASLFADAQQSIHNVQRAVLSRHSIQTKKREKLSFLSHSTQSRGRTGTGVNLLVFETSASTDSAIWASVFD